MNSIPNLDRLAVAATQDTAERTYWLNKLTNPVRSHFPYDFRSENGPFQMERVMSHFTPEIAVRLLELSNSSDVKLNMVLAAAVVGLLYKYTGEKDIIIAVPIYRQQVESEFINTILLLRNWLDGHQTFKELLIEMRKTIGEAAAHQNFPVLMLPLPGLLNLPGFEGQCPLFDVVVLLRNIHDPRYIAHTNHSVSFDFNRIGQKLEGTVQFNCQFFRRETMELVGRRFLRLLEIFIFNVDLELSSIDIITEEERKTILHDFNDTTMAYPVDKTLHELFEEQVERTPDHIALIGSHGQTRTNTDNNVGADLRVCPFLFLTYRELNRQSDQLACFLIEKGVLPDNIIGIMMERSIDQIIEILGILKSGGAYMPIDPKYPQERIDYMLKDSNAKIIINKSEILNSKLRVQTNSNVQDSNDQNKNNRCSHWELQHSNLIYVIYTSGSTGKPKGVMVEHGNVVANVFAFYREFEITEQDCGLQLASYTFDLFAEEVYPLLLKGGKIVIPNPEEVRDIQQLVALINRCGVTLVDTTPLLLSEFNKCDAEISNRTGNITFISGGDLLQHRYVDQLASVGHVYNTYGPTETTICAAYYHYKEKIGENISIGKPIANYQIYILDNAGALQPVGVPGELCITGVGVARGYLNNPELTAEQFRPQITQIKNKSFSRGPGGRFYKKAPLVYHTGDLARWLSDGNIEFLGRIDRQVKIRGFRIELGEIENRLTMHKNIKESVVTVAGNNEDRYLCAYVVCTGNFDQSRQSRQSRQSTTMAEELKEFLARVLPGYMIPTFFIAIEKIPLMSNGKIDRAALPEPVITIKAEHIEPRDPIEVKIRNIWQDLFKQEDIGIDDDFFMLGGHSLKGIQMINALQAEFKVNIPLAEIFRTPCIRQIAQYIKNIKKVQQLKNPTMEIQVNDEQIILLRKGMTNKNLFFIHGGDGEVDIYLELINCLPGAYHYWGIQALRIDHFVPRNVTIPEMARDYIEKIKLIQPNGPYYIVGWCIGGNIGFEILRQLEEIETGASFLILIDTVPPDIMRANKTEPANLSGHLESFIQYLQFPGLIEKVKPGIAADQLWTEMMTSLEEYERRNDEKFTAALSQLKEKMPANLKKFIPHFDRQEAWGLLYYFIIAIVLGNARDRHIPEGKIRSAVHFISAADQEIANREDWNQFCEKPVTYHKVSGDHFSILGAPNVTCLADIITSIKLTN